MKLRIKGNAIRYRLTKSDIDRFATEGRVEETISFAGQPLKYILQQNNGDALSATYKDNVITMYMPVDMKIQWVDTEKVGFNNACGDLELLIEKDFVCLDDVAEDQSDNFPNPLAKK